MRDSLNIYEQIDNYLSNNMSADELATFKNQLTKNPELQQMVENQKLMIQAQQRKILRSEIVAIANGGGFPYGNVLGGIVVAVALTAAIWFGTRPEVVNEIVNTPELAIEIVNTPELVIEADTMSDEAVSTSNVEKLSYAEDTECGGHKTWVAPDSQIFPINPGKGATIEGKEGMLIIIPKDAFIDDKGILIKTPVELELVEALTLEDMVLYDLATLSDGKLLESGGMFYINPTSNGKNVNINPQRPFYIEIPTNEVKPGMMAFKGEVAEDGTLNWIEPKPLKKFLARMDLNNLDFLPEGFDGGVEDGLPFKNHKKISENLIDSLYYSLADIEEEVNEIKLVEKIKGESSWSDNVLPKGKITVIGKINMPSKEIATVYLGNENGSSVVKSTRNGNYKFSNIPADAYRLNVVTEYVNLGKVNYEVVYSADVTVKNQEVVQLKDIFLKEGVGNSDILPNSKADLSLIGNENRNVVCGIDPLSIKAIRTSNFANTYVATNEFEERISVLHKLDNGQELLDVYLNRLGEDMYISDSIVMTKVNGDYKTVFKNYYNEKLTNLKDAKIHQEQLSAYYNKKKKEYVGSIQKLRNDLNKKDLKQIKELREQLNVARDNYRASLKLNSPKNELDNSNSKRASAIAKLVSKLPTRNVVNSPQTYSIAWASAGWANIDSYFHMLAKGSEDVKILAKNGDESTQVYQWLNVINTLTPLSVSNGTATAKFPKRGSINARQMNNTFCFAISKNNGIFKWCQKAFNPYKSSMLTANLKITSLKDIRYNLRLLGVKENNVLNHLHQIDIALAKQERDRKVREEKAKEIKMARESYIATSKEVNDKINKLNAKREVERLFIESLRQIAFPCISANETEVVDEVFDIVEQQPKFPGGAEAIIAYLNTTMVYPEMASASGISGKVYVKFVVRKDGSIDEVSVVRGVHPLLDNEAIRAIKSMPNWTPGTQRGQAVSAWFTLPVNFKLP